MSKTVYFDNNATTQVAPEVREAMMPFFGELYGNPSSMHAFGGQVAAHIAKAREQVAAFLNCEPDEVLFTSCATESDNTALSGTADWYGKELKVITTAVEHPAVLQPARRLKAQGHEVVELPVDGVGQIDLERLRAELKGAKRALVSAMWANNETGTVFPIREIAEIAKECGAVVHTDAVQAAGKVPLDMKRTPVDMLSISGHKFHAPKGVGILFVRRGTKLKPFMLGGHQESGRRAGTENVPYIVGMGVAAELAMANFDKENTYVRKLRDDLHNRLIAAIPSVRVNGDVEHRLPNTTNLSFEYIEGESILMHMDIHGICASSGSACTTGSLEPSHVMRAMGVPYTAAHGAIRFSFSRYNTQEDVDTVVEVLPGIIEKIRAISPYWADFVAKR